MSNATGAIVAIPTDKIMSSFNLWKPEVAEDYYREFGDQGLSTFKNMRSLGMMTPVAADTRTTYAEQKIHQILNVGTGGLTQVSSGAGTYTMLLGAVSPNNDYLVSSSANPPYSAATYYSPAQVNQRIIFPQSGSNPFVATITAITGTAPTLTIAFKLADTTQAAAFASVYTNFVAGTEVAIQSNAFAEGTDQPDPIVTKPFVDTEYVQIIKTTHRITGTQQTNQLWVKKYYDTGGAIVGYQVIGQKDAEYEHELAICYALLTEIPSTNSTFIGSQVEPVKTTEGYIPYAYRRGTNLNYSLGGFNPGLYDQIDKIIIKNFGSMYYQQMEGADLDNEKDNAMKAYLQNTMQSYDDPGTVSDIFGGNKGLAITVNFRQFTKGYRKYQMTRIPEFDMPTVLGAVGFNTSGFGLFAPIGTSMDSKTNVKLPYMGYLYKELGGYSRQSEIWSTNGAGNEAKVLSVDYSQLNYRSHIGASHVGGNQWVTLSRV